MIPSVNTVLIPSKKGGPFDTPHRVLWVSEQPHRPESQAEIVFFRLEAPLSVPFFCNLNEVREWLLTDVLAIGTFPLPAWIQRREDEISERDRRIRDERWALIEPLVTKENRSAIFDRALRGTLLRERETQTSKNRKWLYRLLKLYWRYGQVRNALLPAFDKCAARGEIRGCGDKKRGRPAKVLVVGHDSKATGVNITRDDLLNIYNCVRDLHLRGGESLTATYDKMVDRYYSTIDERNGELFPIPFPENRRMRLPAFRYWANKLLADLSLLREVVGETKWGKRYRGRPGRAADTSIGPTDIFEIDATTDNCHLVSRFNRNHLIGRLIAYSVADRDSTAITGVHTALEGPSWNTARFAIFNTLTDKVVLCKRYGLEITPEEWPFQEAAALWVADQGEILHRDARESLQNMLGLDSDINAAGQPVGKGTVESTHYQISEPISWVPGAWRARAQEWKEKRDKTLRGDACLTLAERTRLLILEILEYNNNVRVEHLLTKEMIADGVKPYRRDIYLWGLENKTGDRIRFEPTQLYRCLLPKAQASITGQGLLYQNMLYLPEGVDHELLLAQARKHRIPATIHYDSNSTNYVYQLNDDTGYWTRWRLTDFCWERYANERIEEVLELNATQKLEAHDAADAEAEYSAIKRHKQKKIVDHAKREKKKSPPMPSMAAYHRGITESRKRERLIERAELARAVPTTSAPPSSENTGFVINFSSAMGRRRAKVLAERKTRFPDKGEDS